jgi:hypothetical protein
MSAAKRTLVSLNYDPADHDKMRLPVDKTCGDCGHIHRCKAMFGHVEAVRTCDWSPSRAVFKPEAEAQANGRAASAQRTAEAPGLVERQAAIENALTMALYFIRQPGTSAANLWAATARANRALTLLKQASQASGTTNTANALGRA